MGRTGRSVVSQCVVEHEDDGHRVAPREDSSQSVNEKIFLAGSIAASGSDVADCYCADSPATG